MSGWELPALNAVLALLKAGLAKLRERRSRSSNVRRVSVAIRELLKEEPDLFVAESALGAVERDGAPIPVEVLRARAMLAKARKEAKRRAAKPEKRAKAARSAVAKRPARRARPRRRAARPARGRRR